MKNGENKRKREHLKSKLKNQKNGVDMCFALW